ncbi:hypothetical protein [Sphingomonas sp.]|uniref:hypothetical protein n=1 Tax=Sphingomonas sp. TaxID=28214 RepID=UPI003CC69623
MTARQEREARLAAQLRANLKRRKAGVRAGDTASGDPAGTVPDADGSRGEVEG